MLKTLTLQNFRGFERHELPLREMTVVVGRNNAGKSTVVEALRLISIVVSRYRRLQFHPGPDWCPAGRISYGVRPSLRNTEINFQGMFHHYDEPPGIITAEFAGGQTVTVYIADAEKFHAVIRDGEGRIVKTQAGARALNLPTVSIMPQVGPVQKREIILGEDYVRSAVSSSLAPLHFRNQLLVFSESMRLFKAIVKETWPGVSIDGLISARRRLNPEIELHLEVRNEDFVGEIGLMGHGLQMWLQTIWFLALSKDAQTVILDEPDVYMHPDLQRRIIRFLRNRHPQCIITTHSVEILSEVRPEEVLVVERRRTKSRFADSLPAVQVLINSVGSMHNISFARLWRSRRLILVEGDDLGFLKAFQDLLFPESSEPIDALPSMPIGGWGGWQYAVGSAMLLQNEAGESITTYCLLDSDYHSPEEIHERLRQAEERNVQLHIWSRKEIENYMLSSTLIQRVIAKSLSKRTASPTEEEVRDKLREIAEGLRDEVLDGLATEISARNRKLTFGTVNKRARERVQEVCDQKGDFLSLIPGKAAISRLSQWSQSEFGVQISPLKLARQIHRAELATEVQSVMTAIEMLQHFD